MHAARREEENATDRLSAVAKSSSFRRSAGAILTTTCSYIALASHYLANHPKISEERACESKIGQRTGRR
jgi:hypothetical protein